MNSDNVHDKARALEALLATCTPQQKAQLADQIAKRFAILNAPDSPPMTIEVKAKQVDTEPPILFYQVNIEDGRGGSWCDAFTSEETLSAYLRGVRMTFAMSALQRLLPDSGDTAPLKFTEQSHIRYLP